MSHGVDQLKELLFDKEHEELSALRRHLAAISMEERKARLTLQARVDELIERAERRKARLDEVYERAGSRERLRGTVAEIIDGVLTDVDSDKTRSADLRKAMVPFVASTVTGEITNNRDVLVQVLSPSIGVMIRDYITSAINDMMAQINRKLEKAIPGRGRKMRAKAKAAGMTMAEVALAETQKLTVVELYLVRRGSGQVIDHWSRDLLDPGAVQVDGPSPGSSLSPSSSPGSSSHGSGAVVAAAGSNRDALVGGFLTAITEFAKEAFEADKSSLRSLQMDGFYVYLRNLPAYLLAAKCSGAPLPGIEQVIDAEFLEVSGRYDAVLAKVANGSASGADRPAGDLKQLLPELARALEARVAARHDELFADEPAGASPLKMAAWIIGLPLLALGGWIMWQSYWTNWTETTTRETLAAISEMKGYPINIDVEPGGGSVRLSGLTPSKPVKGKLVKALSRAMPGVSLHDELTILPIPKPIDPAPKIAAVRRDITRLKVRSNKKLVTLEARNRQRLADLAARAASRQKQLALISTRNKQRLKDLAERNQQKLSDLAATNERRIAELERLGRRRLVQLETQVSRATVARALGRAGKRLEAILSRLQSLAKQLRSSSDGVATGSAGAPARLKEALGLAKKLQHNLTLERSSLAASVNLPGDLSHGLNRLTVNVARINRLLGGLSARSPVARAGKSAAGPVSGKDAGDLPNEPARSAEELSLAVERLSVNSEAAARMLLFKPVEKSISGMSSTIAKLRARIAELTPGPRLRLQAWMASNAIFFAGDTAYRVRARARRKLKTLARLQHEAKALIRVIGYTDSSGQQAKNATLAVQRARKVADELRRLGVPVYRIIAVGHGVGADLNPGAGPGSFNRRVEFKIGFADEQAAGQ